MNKEKIKERINKILRSKVWEIIFIIIYPLLILFLTESIGEYYLINKVYKIKSTIEFGAYILFIDLIKPYLFIILLSLFFRLISKNSFISNLIISIICLLITIISYYKIQVLEIPLLVTDVFLIGNITQIAGYGNISLEPKIVAIIILVIELLAIQFIIVRKQKKPIITKKEIIVRIILAIILFTFIASICVTNDEWSLFGITEKQFEFKTNYNSYGATFVFFKSIENLFPEKLDGYSGEKINDIKNEAEKETQENIDKQEDVKPNVIVIMSESLFDITQVEDLKFSTNPLETIQEVSNKYYGGNIVSPSFEGATSLPEFEFLTGLTTYFFETNTYPYSQYITRDTNSLVGLYKDNNYDCIAIHPNGGNFYNRDTAYSYLGFEKRIFIEDMDIKYKKNAYVSDDALTQQIIKSYEESDDEKNKFIFAVSIQNHTPYGYDNYTDYDISVDFSKDNNISEYEKGRILSYTQGVHDADRAYKKLIEYFNQKEEPVIVAIFGDHLPGIVSLQDIYYNDNNLKKHQTPYCVYTNYEVGEKIEFEKNISAANLGLKILEMSNIQLPWYYQYIQNTYEKYPVITSNFIINQNNEIVTETDIDRIKNYQILQYDLLHKRKYIPVN